MNAVNEEREPQQRDAEQEQEQEQERERAQEREPEEVPFDETTAELRLQLARLSERVRLHLEGR